MNVIEEVGLPKSTGGAAYDSLESVMAFGSHLLVPTVLGTSAHMYSMAELTGLTQFLDFLKNENLAIDSPADVWKFATFVAYIADYRDIAAIQNSANLILTSQAFTTETNLLQAANYTITTFSGECSAYARLYSATQTILNAKKVYNVFFTPDNSNQGGHVTDLWTMDEQTWHISDYFNEYVGSNPLQLLAWLWATQYPNTLLTTSTKFVPNGWSDFSITIVENNFYTGNFNQSTFLTPVMSAHIDDLINQKLVNESDVPSQAINYIQESQWADYQKAADKLFQVENYTNSNLSTSSSTPPTTTLLSSVTQSKTTEYITIGLILAVVLAAMIS